MTSSTFIFGFHCASVNLKDSVVLESTQGWIAERQYPEKESRKLGRRAKQICEGDIPRDCSAEWFEAMAAIAFANFEAVELESLIELRDRSLVEAVGFFLPSLERMPPFAVPSGTQHYPRVGYFEWKDLLSLEYKPGGLLGDKERASLEADLEGLLEDFGISKAEARMKSRLSKPVAEDLVKDVRAQFDFTKDSFVEDKLDMLIVYL